MQAGGHRFESGCLHQAAMRVAFVAFLSLLVLGAPVCADPAERPEGKARYALVGAIETLDPAKCASEAARTCVVNLFDQLYEYDHLKRPYALQPCLAEGMPRISEDGRTHTIRLKKGIRYVDDSCFPGGKGREVTAADVVFCIKRVMDAHTKSPGQWILARRIIGLDDFVEASGKVAPNPRRSAYRPIDGFPTVSGLEAPDDHTLRIHLLQPMPELPWILAMQWFSVYPPEAVRAHGERLGRHAVGTGPFQVTLLLDDRKLLLQWNPGYREEHYPDSGTGRDRAQGLLENAGRRLPLNVLVEVTAYKDPLGAWSAFLNGEADCAEIPRDAFQAVVDPSTGRLLPYLAARGVRLHRDPRLEIFYDAFNWEDPVVGGAAGERGRALRRAICLATDDVWAMTRLYTNLSERVFGPILPEMAGYDRAFSNDWLRQEDETREAALELAREILAEAGIPEARGVPALKMHILDDATSRQVFNILQQQVSEVGIRIEPVPVKWPEMQALLKAKGAQMWTSSWYADYPDAQNFLQLFYGPNAPDPNFSNYQNDEFDALYAQARLMQPGRERDELYQQMQLTVADDCPWRYRFRRIRWSASQPWLSGYRHNDVVAKYFKYCRADEKARAATIAKWK